MGLKRVMGHLLPQYVGLTASLKIALATKLTDSLQEILFSGGETGLSTRWIACFRIFSKARLVLELSSRPKRRLDPNQVRKDPLISAWLTSVIAQILLNPSRTITHYSPYHGRVACSSSMKSFWDACT